MYSTVMSVHRPCVAQAVHGLDIAGLGRHVFQLVPQPLHCDGEGVFVHILRPVRPDPVHQGGPGKGLAPVLHQQPQQLLFRLAELHRNAVPGELHPAEIEGEAVQLHPFRLGGGGPAQLSIHPGPQHRQREGLGDIVIRPQLQTCHDVCLQVIGSQQDYGNLTL
ncbi:Proline--tRNA ligase, partial [Dysosmobacter welbionis]